MLFKSSLIALVLSATTCMAQNSICGSQIYQAGTGQCFNGQLCLYALNPSTGTNNIITYPCGTQCYDAAKYTCNNGVLVVATGVASTAAGASTAAQTQTSGATASATPIQSGSFISSQSRAASSAASAAAHSSSTGSSGGASSSSAAPASSSGFKKLEAYSQFTAMGSVLCVSLVAGLFI